MQYIEISLSYIPKYVLHNFELGQPHYIIRVVHVRMSVSVCLCVTNFQATTRNFVCRRTLQLDCS